MQSSTSFLKIIGAGFLNVSLFALLFIASLFAIALIFPDAESTMTQTTYDAVVAVASLIGLLLGIWFGQYCIMRWVLGRIITGWNLVTLVSYLSVIALIGIFGANDNPLFALDINFDILRMVMFAMLLLVSTLPAIFQWRLLRRTFHGAWWWVIVNLAGWCVMWGIGISLALREEADMSVGLGTVIGLLIAIFIIGAGFGWMMGFPQKGKAKEKRKAVESA